MGERRTITAGWARTVLRSEAAPLALAAGWVLAVYPARPEVLSAGNLRDVGLSAMPLLVVVVGQLFALIVGGVDLSVSAVVGLASVAGALVMAESPTAAAGVATMAGVGLGVGVVHGVSVAVLRMPAFLVTMASLMAVGGAAVWLARQDPYATGPNPLAELPAGFLRLAGGDLLGVPVAVWVAGVVCLAAHLLLTRTTFGRQLYAVGLNPATARVSGVPVAGRVLAAFALAGLCVGIAAVLYTARRESASAQALPPEILLDVLGAAVIGGASLRGGRGTVVGVIAGVAVIALIGNTLTLLDLDHWHVMMAKGGLIFAAAGLDVIRSRRAA